MEEKNATGGREVAWIKSNQGIAACITVVMVLLLAYLASTDWVYEKLRDGFRLGSFTVVATLAMLGCSVSMLFDKHRHEVDPDVARSSWLDWAIAFGAMGASYLYFELAWRVDFLLVTPVFLASGTFALGVRPLRSAIIAGVVITAFVYGIFWAIGIPLPENVLGF